MISPDYCGMRWLDDIHPIATRRMRERVRTNSGPMPCYYCGVGDWMPGVHICAKCNAARSAIAPVEAGQLSLL